MEKDLAYDEWELDRSKRDTGISSSMYVADLSDSTMKFSHVHEFEVSKPLPMVMKIKEQIYTLSTNRTYYAMFSICASPSFEVYDPSHSSESITRLWTPPFHERFERSFTNMWDIRLC